MFKITIAGFETLEQDENLTGPDAEPQECLECAGTGQVTNWHTGTPEQTCENCYGTGFV